MESTSLKRALSLPVLTFYGLGTVVGAGIYVLVGRVAAVAGMAAPLAFVLAAIVAAFTGLSYAELSSRLPKSAGEAAYVAEAFGSSWLSALTGYAVVLTGIVSAAAIANGFVGYARLFLALPHAVLLVGVVLALGAIAAWGIELAAGTAVAITVVELLGLAIVVGIAGDSLANLPEQAGKLWPGLSGDGWRAMGSAAVLAFYAFVGFEDMVNVAEEVKDPSRNMPRAISIVLVVVTVLYVLVALVAVLSLPLETLSRSEAPLADIVTQRSARGRTVVGALSMVAVINGALVQIVMASRVLYGMGKGGTAPRLLAAVHPARKTPLAATALSTGAVLCLALGVPIEPLARATSLIMLCVFALVNACALRLRRRPGAGIARYPAWVPALGLATCAAMLGAQILG